MKSINKVILVGNVTRDPEKKSTPGGQTITTFGVATNRDWVTSQGERNSMTEFHSIVAWGKLGDICAQLLRKGKLVYVEGYLKTRSWDNENGIKSFRTEIIATDVILLDRDKRAPGREEEMATAEDEQPQPSSMEADAGAPDDLDNLF